MIKISKKIKINSKKNKINYQPRLRVRGHSNSKILKTNKTVKLIKNKLK